MAAIDWLFNSTPTSERMHQAVLAGLLRHTRLLDIVTKLGQPTDLMVEPRRGLYDFTINLPNGRKMNIELKVDAPLSEHQVKRQLEGLAENESMLYLLLGVTRFEWRRWRLDRERPRIGRPPDENSLLRVDLDQLLNGIDALAAGTVDDRDLRDLAVAYGGLLRKIQRRTNCFAGKPLPEWNSLDWHGFYAELNERLDVKDGGQGTVNPPNGNSFVGFWWKWSDIPLAEGAEAYLQLEQDRLCFKVTVTNAGERAHVRNRFCDAVLSEAEKTGLRVQRPARFGNGLFMTSAIATDDYRCSGGTQLDWDFCLKTIRQAMEIFERAVGRVGA
jgi:hypothetical protein